ncbi:MAG: polysaccharide deacetylase family protein, partial [bacterium]
RHLAYHQLWQILHQLPGSARERALDAIREWAAAPNVVEPDSRPLSPQEVRQLTSGRLVEIGGHSVTHPFLPLLDREGQRREIVENKLRLEELIERPLRHFAYPHGQLTEETVALVKQAGYRSACTSEVGAVDRSADPFRLPRVGAQDWNREEFAHALRDRFAV